MELVPGLLADSSDLTTLAHLDRSLLVVHKGLAGELTRLTSLGPSTLTAPSLRLGFELNAASIVAAIERCLPEPSFSALQPEVSFIPSTHT